ncbi:hypothetical protein HY490_04470 [Candidatus Woesearchaeota archaeon]|nr:hypothetical protein [Candidatus Woesearchaeota archaeon]
MLCPDEPRKARYHAKREFTLALARYVIRPQVEAVIAAGARWVQLDAPAATLDLEHIPIFVEGINEVVRGLDAKFSIHLCYPRRITPIHKKGYEMLFPHVLNLDSRVNHFSLELANAEDYENDLHPFVRCGRKFEIGVGVVDITLERQQSGTIEKPETVRQRIAAALNVLKDPALVYVAPDCGLRQLTLERAIRLYEVMVLGTELARRG